ncbi:YlmH family RNA-binding protein [Streptococcus sciuri]|uniref:YlmH/Sll1252 family protein n=1 Tax=Streptococcus sciuri TaxID=2973939 RepID=A0ABT2F823_9STRE|nr:YlmH/Sll1252 family protein [Streptococcus sciuri]MCS4488564.1 YlmH/Sll1252 family protein [Streptococcus sciuri]
MLQHFHKDELIFVEKTTDIINRVEDTYAIFVTEFLNPRELEIVESLVASSELICYSSNDYFDTEYGKAIIAPSYYQFDKADFQLSLLEIHYNNKFNRLTHAQILGAFLHQLGVERSLIGDIRLNDNSAQLFLTSTMVNQALQQITKIGQSGITMEEVPFSRLMERQEETQKIFLQVSSLRLDKILASSFKLSRLQAVKLIESGKVKVNYRTVEKGAEQLLLGDMISVRDFGRIRLIGEDGLTKSGKHKITIEKLKHK